MMSSEIEMRGAQTENQFGEKLRDKSGLGDFQKADWNLTGAVAKVNRRGMTKREDYITCGEATIGRLRHVGQRPRLRRREPRRRSGSESLIASRSRRRHG